MISCHHKTFVEEEEFAMRFFTKELLDEMKKDKKKYKRYDSFKNILKEK